MMRIRATTRPHDTFIALEKATPFSSHFFSICWGIIVISVQIYSDQGQWSPLELGSARLVAAWEGACRRKAPNLALGRFGVRESIIKEVTLKMTFHE